MSGTLVPVAKAARTNMLVEQAISATVPVDSTATFTQRDELEFRRLAQSLRSRRPDRCAGQSIEAIVASLKSNCEKHYRDSSSTEALILLEHRICGASQTRVETQPPIATALYANAQGIASGEPQRFHESGTTEFVPSETPASLGSLPVASNVRAATQIERTEPELCKEQSDLVNLFSADATSSIQALLDVESLLFSKPLFADCKRAAKGSRLWHLPDELHLTSTDQPPGVLQDGPPIL